MTPVLSVCIMTYNRAEVLRETLDSVLPQVTGLAGVEVLVSDNASPDHTEEVMRDYCARYPTLRYSRNPTNVGFDGNVVACIENATGEYVAFCSDDDLAPPDLFPTLLKELIEIKPIVAYINHSPFYADDPKQLDAPTQPVLKRVFTNPSEYFLYCGLGFISSLTLKRSEALKHIGKIYGHGRDTGHVEIAARTVLSTTGPYLFDGTLTILARHTPNSTYDPLRKGAMNTTEVHLELLRDGLLSQENVDWHNRKTICLFLQRLIVNNRLKGAKGLVSAGELRKMYGRDPLFYLYVYPLALIPPTLLRWMALPLRGLMRMRRKWLAEHGKTGAPPPHMAPP
jgi:glycosyltransferase involved in cell wall biosynthesis